MNTYSNTNHSSFKQKENKAYKSKIKRRLLDPPGKWPDAKINLVADILESLPKRDQGVLVGILKAIFRTKKTQFSLNYLSKVTDICPTSISRSLTRMAERANELVGYTKKEYCSHKSLHSEKNLNPNAIVLKIQRNGFSVVERATYKTNIIFEKSHSFGFGKGFVENLPFLAKKSSVCAGIFACFRRCALITHSKRNVLKSLGIKQFESFKRFSCAALHWAGERLKERLSRHARIRDRERFLWSVCYRYDIEYNMLRE